jgi:hypothetical protein
VGFDDELFIGDRVQLIGALSDFGNFEKIGNRPWFCVGDDVNSDNKYSSPFENKSFSQKEMEKSPELNPPKAAVGWRFSSKLTINKLSTNTPEEILGLGVNGWVVSGKHAFGYFK